MSIGKIVISRAVCSAVLCTVALPLLTACGTDGLRGDLKSTTEVNRLGHQSSPYLRQHAHDPVDWYPWGEEAFKKAQEENKPILLSIGYSSCHWCHVMQHESFQDKATAKLMNQGFVCVKVDREERPDIDEVYMRAVQAMTGRGGWPATLFLTPKLKPFFAGTYFPNKEIYGLPSFKAVLVAVQKAWADNPTAQEKVSAEIVSLVSNSNTLGKPASSLGTDTIDYAIGNLLKGFDAEFGGIGEAPKFPMPEPLSLCLRMTTAPVAANGLNRKQLYFPFVETTLDKMAMGGIHDHVGGGFCRYSTDRQWRIPHFEKMLYDNAMIAQNYLDGFQVSGKKRLYWAQTARDTLDFVMRELRAPQGAFFSSLDADSEGGEGAYYSFSKQDIDTALDAKDSSWFCNLFGVTKAGNYQAKQNILCLTETPQVLAQRNGLSLTQFLNKVGLLQKKLLRLRSLRQPPRRDDKVITSWNALMISSLVRGYQVLGDDKYLDAAKQDAHFLISNLYVNHRLQRSWTAAKEDGLSNKTNDAFLEDYALTIQAFLDLASVDSDPVWLRYAQELNQAVLDHFRDSVDGSFYFTADYQQQPIARLRGGSDSSIPSGAAVEIQNLTRLALITGNGAYRETAERVLRLYVDAMRIDPISYATMLKSLDYYLRSRTEIVVVTATDSVTANSACKQLITAINEHFAPNTVMVSVTAQDAAHSPDALLQGKTAIKGRPAVYICHDQTCGPALTELSQLRKRLIELVEAGSL